MALAAGGLARGRGPAASLDPACRLLCLAFLSSAALFASWPFSACMALGAFSLLRLEGLGTMAILRESAFILVFALLTAFMRLLGAEDGFRDMKGVMADSAVYGLKLLSAFLAGRLFYASTRLSELRDGATRIARRIPLLRRFDVGLGLSLILGYIPLIFQEWRDSLEAARSRGMSRRLVLSQQSRFIAAFLRRLMLKAVSLPQALASRGWTRDRGLSPSTWRIRDSVSLFLSVSALFGSLLCIV